LGLHKKKNRKQPGETIMRSRNIKPGFFKNEELAECDLSVRVLFIGLWCLADRDGRLEYRPKKIKVEVFPYDNFNIEKLLKQLDDKKFIKIYHVNNENYIQITNFTKHQNPHIKEPESTIPTPDKHSVEPGLSDTNTISTQLIPDSPLLIPDSRSPQGGYSDDFLLFWKAYPAKVEKQYAYKCWKKIKDRRPPLQTILEAIQKQVDWRKNANGEFRPDWKHPATWLNRGCWEDELKIEKKETW
jgi:uncharacterized protein YlbG (UPF0298 family)